MVSISHEVHSSWLMYSFLKIDRPAQPTDGVILYQRSNGTVKISWTSNQTDGIDHSYKIIIRNMTTSTPQVVVNVSLQVPCYVVTMCGEFSVQLKAVNGAGESEPSDTVRVSLPLLPDVTPVNNSLSHHVWKSSGEVFVQILYEVSICTCNQSARYFLSSVCISS